MKPGQRRNEPGKAAAVTAAGAAQRPRRNAAQAARFLSASRAQGDSFPFYSRDKVGRRRSPHLGWRPPSTRTLSMRRSLVLPAVALPTVFAVLSFASAACAHETIPKDWCSGESQQPLVLETFSFSGDQLRQLAIKCGIVDQVKPGDDWSTASAVIGEYCNSLALSTDEPVPFISGPKSYGVSAHHDSYSLDAGLSGICAVCVTP